MGVLLRFISGNFVLFIGSMFAGLFDFFVKLFSKIFAERATKVSVNLVLLSTYIAVLISLIVAFFISLELLIVGIKVVMPLQYFDLVSPFWPSNFQLCFSAVLSARILKFSLIYAMRFRKEILKVSTSS